MVKIVLVDPLTKTNKEMQHENAQQQSSPLENLESSILDSAHVREEKEDHAGVEESAEYHAWLRWMKYHLAKQREEHLERLVKVLIECNKDVHFIPGDGNCFFNSVCHQVRSTNPDLDCSKLRNIVCDHLVELKDCYINFIEEEDGKNFEDKIDAELRTSGQWNTALGDLLPLLVANLFQSRVEIFSSKEDSPYLMIVPDSSLPEHESSVKHNSSNIQLVYTAVPGMEHYDSCLDATPEDDIATEEDNQPAERKRFFNHVEEYDADDDEEEVPIQSKPAKRRRLFDYMEGNDEDEDDEIDKEVNQQGKPANRRRLFNHKDDYEEEEEEEKEDNVKTEEALIQGELAKSRQLYDYIENYEGGSGGDNDEEEDGSDDDQDEEYDSNDKEDGSDANEEASSNDEDSSDDDDDDDDDDDAWYENYLKENATM